MYNPAIYSSKLSLEDSNVLKGIALALLLIHHLFGIPSTEGFYNDIVVGNHGIVNEIGRGSKLCVAIFVFLSGYGLTVQTENRGEIGSLTHFYRHRLLKLLLNYWFIWLIFVPIGVLVFGRTLLGTYHDHFFIKLIADVLGVAYAFGFYGYNATWWFLSCIIVYYLFYPILYILIKRYQFESLILFISLALLPIIVEQQEIVRYALPFVLGIYFAIRGIPIVGGKFCVLLLMGVGLILFGERMLGGCSIVIDCILCVLMSAIWLSISKKGVLKSSLSFLGRHSMNIFLFHTFIFSHWFKNFVFSPRNPILIFLLFVIYCVIISIIIERLKKILLVDKLIKLI